MPEVRQERTGWRDGALSERHRGWGWDCPMIDIDFLALEYDDGKAVAIVEYKHEEAQPQLVKHLSYQAMIDLGDRATMPVFAVRYASDFSWWKVCPLNGEARRWLRKRKTLTEKEWVTLLYNMRGRQLPEKLFNGEE